MKKNGHYTYAIILIWLLSSVTLVAQSYQIGRLDTTFIDHQRDGRSINTLVLYPADSAGTRVPLASTDHEGFPVLIFGHGYQMPVEAYRNIWESTVPEGFVFVLPETGSGMFPSHQEFGKDLAFLLEAMLRLNEDTTSGFFGRLHSSGSLMGHSMGGGAAFLGAALLHAPQSQELTTVLTMAPMNTRPSAAKAAVRVSVPALIFAGTADWITPPEKHQIPTYDSLGSRQKYLISIKGGTHCQMAENNKLCNFAEVFFDQGPVITREDQHQILKRYMLPWLKFFLYGDTESGIVFDQQLEADTSLFFIRQGLLQPQ